MPEPESCSLEAPYRDAPCLPWCGVAWTPMAWSPHGEAVTSCGVAKFKQGEGRSMRAWGCHAWLAKADAGKI